MEYLQTVWRRRVIVLVCTLTSLGLMIAVDTVRPSKYASTAKVSFGTRTLTVTAMGTNLIRLGSTPVRTAAKGILGVGLPSCSIKQEGTTAIVDITCNANDPSLAARAANAWADGYNQVMRSQSVWNALSAAQYIRGLLDAQNATVSSLTSAAASVEKNSVLGRLYSKQLSEAYATLEGLRSQLSSVELASINPRNAISILQLAAPNRQPLSPKPTSDAILAFIAGLALGVGIAVVRETMDDKLRTRTELEALSHGRPAIGLIPSIREWEDRKTPLLISAEQPKSPPAEAFRSLRTSLQFMSLDDPIKTLLITSPAAADGKTTVTSNLAYTIASAGQEVIIVGCDLRKPRIHEFFGVSNDVGFTSVMLGEVDLDDAIIEVPGSAYLKILPAGPIPPNPAELLSGRRAQLIMEQIKERCDIVIIDSPPMLPVSDAQVLAAKADAVILVAAAGISTKRDVARSMELMMQVDAALIGVVLNRAPSSDGYSYYRYGYGYGYGEGYGYGYGYGGSGAYGGSATPVPDNLPMPEPTSTKP